MENAFWSNIFKKKPEAEKSLSDILKSIPIFSGLSGSELKKVEQIVHLRNYRDQEVIFRQNEPGVGMYVIRSGEVDIVYDWGKPSARTLAHLETGDFFGEMALLDETPRSASAVAMEPSELIGFFRPDLLDLIERNPRLGVKIILPLSKLLGERLRRTNEKLQALSQFSEGEPEEIEP
ncbi:MAG: cyclic nucleotide-binding domain-containing protein [Candidatus Latescibacteria bacterium]|nr:cyclic nucleotide-binding domain-containing protein [Candidatus Latescibacterota bacterium]